MQPRVGGHSIIERMFTMYQPRYLLGLAAGALLAFGAHAQTEASIKQAIERNTQGKVRVDAIQATPAKGIYQIISDGEIFYTDASGRYGLVGGSLVDMQTQKDLTTPVVEQLTSVPFKSLPLKYAIKEVHGNGKRQITLFEDPNCPICRVFTKFVSQLDDVTIYRFMFPVIDPSSQQLARTAWCSGDRAAAWEAAMAGRRITGDQSCDVSGLAEILKFGEKHRIQNTPTVFLGNGKRLVGATSPEQFIAELDASVGR